MLSMFIGIRIYTNKKSNIKSINLIVPTIVDTYFATQSVIASVFALEVIIRRKIYIALHQSLVKALSHKTNEILDKRNARI